MTAILGIWGFLKNLPREVWYIAAAAALLWWIDARAYDRGYDARTAEYEQQSRRAQERARAADGQARQTVSDITDRVEAGNERAREAANGSDPLGDALRSLRNQ